MSIHVYDQTIGVMTRMLTHLDRIVGMAAAWAEEKNIDPDALLTARLYPDMLTFMHQVRIATDIGKGAAARLTGTEVPSWEDNEQTFAEARGRIRKALDYFATFSPDQFDGAEEREIELNLRFGTLNFTGKDYVLNFVLPNFYFHVTTAYNLLRHNGLEIGKADYIAGGHSPGTGN